MIHCVLVLLAWGLRAFGDAIDHGKGNRRLLDLWHVVMLVSYLLLIGDIVYLTGGWCWIVVPVFAWIVFEVVYRTGRMYNVEDLDDKVKIPIIWRLWRGEIRDDGDKS